MGIGQDLLDVPFPQMVLSLAQAIAKGQTALDLASLGTLKALAKTKFDYIPEITEVLTPHPITAGGITVTGVDVSVEPQRSFKMTLLQAGMVPTFYQFTESIIEVKISLSSKVDTSIDVDSGFEFDTSVSTELGFGGGLLGLFGGPSGKISSTTSFSSHVNITTSTKYSYSAEGSSLLRTTLKPVPPPSRIMPRFISVNTLVSPTQVTVTQ
jgi:hypothetical protein